MGDSSSEENLTSSFSMGKSLPRPCCSKGGQPASSKELAESQTPSRPTEAESAFGPGAPVIHMHITDFEAIAVMLNDRHVLRNVSLGDFIIV